MDVGIHRKQYEERHYKFQTARPRLVLPRPVGFGKLRSLSDRFVSDSKAVLARHHRQWSEQDRRFQANARRDASSGSKVETRLAFVVRSQGAGLTDIRGTPSDQRMDYERR